MKLDDVDIQDLLYFADRYNKEKTDRNLKRFELMLESFIIVRSIDKKFVEQLREQYASEENGQKDGKEESQ
jgi:hypothetical protein